MTKTKQPSTPQTEISRPKWVELTKLTNQKTCNAAAERLFGYKPSERYTSRPEPYGADEFVRRFGVDVTKLHHFYAETAQANAPEGPLTPASERLPIRPILAIRQQPDGTYGVEGLEMQVGFFNRTKTRAWVPVDEFLDLMGDTYFVDMEKELAAERERMLRQIEKLKTADLTEEQQAVWARVREGVQFEDLSEQERNEVANIMVMLREGDDDAG